MKRFVVYRTDTGEILRTVVCAISDAAFQAGAGEAILEADGRDDTHYVAGGVLVALPNKPDAWSQFNWITKAWFDPRTLVQRKALKWAEIKMQRSRLEMQPFSCAGLSYDPNESKIVGAVLDAMAAKAAGEQWSQAWVLADNSTTTLGADQMIAVGRAMRAQFAALWARGAARRADIAAARTAAEIDLIAW